MPKRLPSGLNAFEPSDTVRREAQNANIEVLDQFINKGKVHRHTGLEGDAPQIGKDGIESGAIERHHLISGNLSKNIAKYSGVDITGGELQGLPTAPYYYSSSGGYNWWRIPRGTGYPQSITIYVEESVVQGVSFDFIPEPNEDKPFNCIVEIGYDDNQYKEVYNGILDGKDRAPYIRFAEPQLTNTVVITFNGLPSNMDLFFSRFAVYSFHSKGIEEEFLDDIRTWGLIARLQGLMVISPNPIIDNGNSVTLGGHIYVLNPLASASFSIVAGTYQLLDNQFLYAKFEYRNENHFGVYPSVGTAQYNTRPQMYGGADNFLILYRFAGKIYLNPIIKAKLQDKNGVPISLQASGHGDELLNALQTSDLFAGTSATFKADKESIVAGGSDKMAVEVHLTDWQGKDLEDASEQLIVDLNGLQRTVQVSKGKGSLVVSSDEPGEFLLQTVGLDRNAQLKVVVVDGK